MRHKILSSQGCMRAGHGMLRAASLSGVVVATPANRFIASTIALRKAAISSVCSVLRLSICRGKSPWFSRERLGRHLPRQGTSSVSDLGAELLVAAL